MTEESVGAAPAMRRVRREPNRRRLHRGIGVAVAAVALVVAGVVLSEARGALTLANPVARADRREPMTFEASEQRYDIWVAPADPLVGFQDREVASTRCTVTLADGTTAEIRGDRQSVSEETSFGRSAGYFRAIGGPTTVVCDNNGGSQLLPRFVVAPHRAVLLWVSWVMIGVGVVAGLVALWLIRSGLRGRLVVEPST